MATNNSSDLLLHSIDDTYFSLLLGEEGTGEGDLTFPDDAKYSEALQLQEALMGSVLISQNVKPCPDHYVDGPIRVVKKAKVEPDSDIGDSSMSFCEICMERKENEQMFDGLSCAHSYCSDCVSKHVVAKLQGNVASVGCPGLGCEVVLGLEACMPILSKRVIDDWSDLLCREMIDASQRFYCPYKDCSGMMIVDVCEKGGSGVAEAECPFCRRLFCARCSVPWHVELGCDEYQKLGEDERGRDDVMLMRLARDKKWCRCPMCKFYVERTEGCPHMICRCRFEFCYGCGSKWSPSHTGCARN